MFRKIKWKSLVLTKNVKILPQKCVLFIPQYGVHGRKQQLEVFVIWHSVLAHCHFFLSAQRTLAAGRCVHASAFPYTCNVTWCSTFLYALTALISANIYSWLSMLKLEFDSDHSLRSCQMCLFLALYVKYFIKLPDSLTLLLHSFILISLSNEPVCSHNKNL